MNRKNQINGFAKIAPEILSNVLNLAEEVVALCEEQSIAGTRPSLFSVRELICCGQTYYSKGDFLLSQAYYHQALALLGTTSTPLAAHCLFCLGLIDIARQNFPRAESLLYQSLSIFEARGERNRDTRRNRIRTVHVQLVSLYRMQGRLEQMGFHLRSAIALGIELENERHGE